MKFVFAFILLIAGVSASAAETAAENKGIASVEEVIFINRELPLVDAKLETTLYRPDGTPPWPLVVLNHGSEGLANPRLQPRSRPIGLVNFFLRRGYLVAVPMRQGFSKSTGVYSWHCDHRAHAERYGGDITAVVDYLVKQELAARDQILVVGQSAGALVALGYAASSDERTPKARAVINFSGGMNSVVHAECDTTAGLVEAGRSFGAATHIPSLWIYARDDEFFPPEVSQPFFDAFHAGQPLSTLKLYDHGGHAIAATGVNAWRADVVRFLRQTGLPAEMRGAGREPR